MYTIGDIARDPQYRARGMILEVPHPRFGSVTMPGDTPVLTETPGAVCSPGPVLGEHTETVLQEIARLTPEEIAALRRERVI